MRKKRRGKRAETNVVAPTHEILNHIRSETLTTRAQIAEHYNIALSTVTLRIKELIDRQLITEEQGPSHGGRPTLVLKANRNDIGILVVDLTPERNRMCMMDLAHNVKYCKLLSCSIKDSPELVVREISANVNDNTVEWGLRPKALAVIVPGPVNIEIGQVVSAANMPQWHGYNFLDELTKSLDIPVLIENDANAIAFAHNRMLGSVVKSSFSLLLDYGLGCGIIEKGAIFRGANGLGGDFSHSTMNNNTTLYCKCGKRNCLDALASGRGIVAMLQDANKPVESIDDAILLARNGDQQALSIFTEAADRLSEVVAIMVNLLNPSTVYLSGRLCQVDDYLSTLTARVYDRAYPGATQYLRVLDRQDKDDLLRGGTLLCLEQLTPTLDVAGLLAQ